jgi:AcrR family transcriptional regulator
MTSRPYHHGDLRRALLGAAVEAIGESGPAALSLRDLARRAGVSHAAPAHHFGDKAGLLTALAAEGFALLASAVDEARRRSGSLLEIGVAYVSFAVQHRAHFEVMFRPELYHADDAELAAARTKAREVLRAGVSGLPPAGSADLGGADAGGADAGGADAERLPGVDPATLTGLAAWSIVHGFASLWMGGALPSDLGDDPETAARAVIRLLFARGS